MSGSEPTPSTLVWLLSLLFTEVSDSDTVTVSSTTITGAKSLTYEKAVTGAAITTAAGADVVIFEEALPLIGDVTNSGSDSIQFLKDTDVSEVNLGAGADSLYGAQV